MLEALSKGFRNAKNRLAGLTELSEENLAPALRDVRLSLLEADVELHVAKNFIERVKEQLTGQVVATTIQKGKQSQKVSPTERFIAACQQELEQLMSFEGQAIDWAKKPEITGIMMVGLQGAGKTTTTAKLARLLESQGHKPLLVAADTQRPAAVEQLQTLGQRLDIPVFAIPGGKPVLICQQGRNEAKKLKRDVVIYDTAGRLAVDDALMRELEDIKQETQANNIFLVIDAMIGQDAVNTAREFHQRLDLSGVVLTKLDGDARGGAALSVKEVTGAPIKYVGLGEELDKLEEFRAEGLASRILGFGDVVGLMKDFEQVADVEKAEQDAKRMLSGQFSLDDFLEQITVLQRMGPLKDVMEKLPFFSESMPEGAQLDDRELDRTKAMVSSMTPQERVDVGLFAKQRTRVQRVARGSGTKEQQVVSLLQRFSMMQQMMGNIGSQAGLLAKVPGMKQLAMANQLRSRVKMGGFENNPMMDNLASSLFEAAVAESGGVNAGQKSTKQSMPSKDKKRKQRKAQRKARKKTRKK